MTQARDIIVIAASLGGLEALCRLVRGFSADLPAAILIVLHTSRQSPGLLAEIVGQHTSLSVSYGQQGDTIKSGHVYFAPPDLHLAVVAPGFLMLRAGPKVHFTRPAADVLFLSAAQVYGPRVIGVVLTGGDHDGTEGLRVVKAAGGMSVVQDPIEARDPSMPRSALIGDHPDYTVPLDEMATLLTRLAGR